ncbi:MAG TPA: hypothetical protein VK207_05350 [Bacteroidales bacterium]|nr:hypothetical protein [Bacteroidales bacterium]
MKKILYFLLIPLFAFSTAGCREEPIISHDQEILFQMDYVNYAWGFQHYGFMIDNLGRILTYDNPDKWNFPDNNFILTEDQVDQNISMCRISGEKISREELGKFSSYIDKISSSKITAMRNTGADAGTLQYICFSYSENSHMYKGVLVKSEGDFSAENLNFHSKKVVAWMRSIEESIASR